jgi:Tfp pilus assembly protein PilV
MHTHVGRKPEHGEDGFTLVELLVSFSALMVVLLGLSRMLLSSQMASNTSHEATLAKEAARAEIEVLAGMTLADVYKTYNANGNDDPGVPNSAPGANFAVHGLEAPVDDADGQPGRILFPEQGGVLSEFANAPQYGWPIDMDGVAGSTADVSTTYRLLPVVVRVEWRGSGGNGKVEFKTLLGGL